MSSFYKGSLLVSLSAIGFGLMPIFAKYAYSSGVTTETLLFLRFFIASIFLFMYLFITRARFHLTKSQIGLLIILGGILYTLQSNFYFSAVKYIPASLAALLLYLYPIFVTLLAVIFEKQRVTIIMILVMILAFTGVGIVLGVPTDHINHFGILLAVGAAVIYSIYILVGNRLVSSLSPVVTTSFVTLFSSISILILGLSTDSLSFAFHFTGWYAILGVAILSTVIAILAFFMGIKYIGSTRASILSTLEPNVTVISSFLFLSESLTIVKLVGMALVVFSAVLVVMTKE